MTWTTGDDWHVMNSGLPTGDLSAAGYTKLHIEITSITNNISNPYITVKIASTGKDDQYVPIYVGVNNIAFADYSADIDFSKVTEISFWGSGDEGSAVITDCYLYGPVKTITVATGFGDEITSMDYITEGNKFVISNGTNALYFEGDQDAKDAAVQSVPNTSYYYYTLTEIKLDLNSDEALETYYAINIVNEAGTAFPAPYSLGNCLNFTGNTADSGNNMFSGSCQSDKAQGYGTDCQYKGLWEITYSSENGGFALRNVGASKYAIVRGNSGEVTYLKLYKSIVFSSSTDLEKENSAANDAIFAFTNATGYNAETGELTNGTWTFGTPVDLSDWDYLMITTINSGGDSSHEIIIKDVNDVTVQGEGYSGSEAGTGKNMWLDTWNNQNAIRISMDYLRKNKSMDISQIKSLKINGTVKVANVYLTDYNNTKINGGYCTGDVVREYAAIDKFGTICLPYKASCAGAEIYEIAGKTASSVTLAKVTGLLEAGKPYFYLASDAVGKYEWGTAKNIYNVNFFRADLAKYDAASAGTDNGLIGTFDVIEELTPGNNIYILSSNKLYNVDAGATEDKAVKVGANKAYIDISQITNTAGARSINLMFNEPTGINAVSAEGFTGNGEFYNLQGQRVSAPRKGLYIVNGKVIVIK